MNPIVTMLVALGGMFTDRVRALRAGDPEAGNALELVILVVGLVTIATVVVAAITAAVQSRLSGLG